MNQAHIERNTYYKITMHGSKADKRCGDDQDVGRGPSGQQNFCDGDLVCLDTISDIGNTHGKWSATWEVVRNGVKLAKTKNTVK